MINNAEFPKNLDNKKIEQADKKIGEKIRLAGQDKLRDRNFNAEIDEKFLPPY